MTKTLILTGWKHFDYAVAAALALRHYGKADILGMSRRRLPEFLEDVSDYSEIAILGVSLAGDAERLGKALERLGKNNVEVLWLSGIDFPEWIGESVRANLDSCISPSGSVSIAVAEHFGMEHSVFDDYLDERTPVGKKYQEFMKASEYYYRNFQDEQAYPRVIRHIAAGDAESKWSEGERRMVENYRRYGHRELVGKSAAIAKLQEQINLIAPQEHARVLILGESGTGKETVATLIHLKSPRGQEGEPFIAFNCASVTPNLLESRFLGYEKGAFTGASEQKAGLFEAANGGTLFLDEIGELPLEAQGVLLRVLEEGRFQRLGANAHEIEVDVRVIAATNRDLPAMVRDGKFRADLYHRLCVVQLRVPPLREHKEDIALMAYSYRDRNGMGGWLSSAQAEALQSYDFPGNVRELFNLLERAYVLGIDDYTQLIREHKELNAALLPQADVELPDNLEEATRLHVKRVCEKYSHNITKAAEAMGVSRNTVRKYLE
ncbi:MAG: sigma-54-dependent Fis family transcriptional regulator [Victivallales bacterium]|nr:sigma-54-dependent Fis family transcriptional regulator [Victivallales bacterium]